MTKRVQPPAEEPEEQKRSKVPNSGRQKGSVKKSTLKGGVRLEGEVEERNIRRIYPLADKQWHIDNNQFYGNPPFTKIENVLIDHLLPKLLPRDWAFLCVLLRKTVGFHKTHDFIAEDQMIKLTGMSQNTVRAAAGKLEEMRVIETINKKLPNGKDAPKLYKLNPGFYIEIDRSKP